MVEIDWSLIIAIFGAIIATISLILHWRRFKLEKPNISATVVKSSYKLFKHQTDTFSFSVSCLLVNKGNANGSVIDVQLLLKPENPNNPIHKEPPLYHNVVIRPSNFADELPIKISPYGSEKAKFEFHAEKINLESVRRCQMPINFFKPKKWSKEDLPLYFELVFKTTSGKIESCGCIFREDLEESKKIIGSFGLLEEFNLLSEK